MFSFCTHEQGCFCFHSISQNLALVLQLPAIYQITTFDKTINLGEGTNLRQEIIEKLTQESCL